MKNKFFKIVFRPTDLSFYERCVFQRYLLLLLRNFSMKSYLLLLVSWLSLLKNLGNATTSFCDEAFFQNWATFQFRSWLSREWYCLLLHEYKALWKILSTTKTNINIINNSNNNNNTQTTHTSLQIDAYENIDGQNNNVKRNL